MSRRECKILRRGVGFFLRVENEQGAGYGRSVLARDLSHRVYPILIGHKVCGAIIIVPLIHLLDIIHHKIAGIQNPAVTYFGHEQINPIVQQKTLLNHSLVYTFLRRMVASNGLAHGHDLSRQLTIRFSARFTHVFSVNIVVWRIENQVS